ncbi:unnamed protein product [Caenorhabditis angaria]|uniref:Uncharacterized protein n=1 Tax=Caenorhabditis angaria TaxID=860376 RepID=A0A9P1I7P8_9PELO|nr:unnamed protein product [Caenorhabditis angaria]
MSATFDKDYVDGRIVYATIPEDINMRNGNYDKKLYVENRTGDGGRKFICLSTNTSAFSAPAERAVSTCSLICSRPFSDNLSGLPYCSSSIESLLASPSSTVGN